MQKVTKILPLVGLFGLLGCEDSSAECERLLHDKEKQPLAFDVCKKAADDGNALAQFRTAEWLFQQGEDERALEYLTKSANQHQPQALLLMAQRRENSGLLEGARFYYEQSCKRNVMLACEWLAKQKQQQVAQKQEEAEEKVRLQAELVTAEKARKEAEQKQLAEEKARQEAELLKQEAEQKAKQAEEQARLAEANAQKQAKNTLSFQSMSQTELRQTYSDFVSEIERRNYQFSQLENWVKNCYANSTAKKGCFYFDVLVSITDKMLSDSDKSRAMQSFFKDYMVRSRARQHIPEFSYLSVEQDEALFQKVANELLQNSYLFEEMSNVRQKRLAQKSAENAKSTGSTLQKFEQNGLWGFTDQHGNIVIRPQYLAVGGFYDGLAVVQSPHNRFWGFIDQSGNWLVSPQFCMAGRFSEGLAGAYKNGYYNAENQCVGGKWGYLNTAGNWAINPIFEQAERFKNGKAKVTYKGTTGYINQYGNWAQ